MARSTPRYELQTRGRGQAFKTIDTAYTAEALAWGFKQFLDARYFRGVVRVVDPAGKVVVRAEVKL